MEFAKILYQFGLFNTHPILVDGKEIVPLKFFSKIAPKVPTPKDMQALIKAGIIENGNFALIVEIIGKELNKKVKIKSSIVFPDLKQISKNFPGSTYISYPTGTAAYAFFKGITHVKKYGVYPPEALDPPVRKKILLELKSRGIIVNEEYSCMN